MNVSYFNTFAETALSEVLLNHENNQDSQTILILVAGEQTESAEAINSLLKQHKKKVVGGFFPGIIFNENKYESGFLVVTLENKIVTSTIYDLSEENTRKQFSEQGAIDAYSNCKTMLVLVDGLAKGIKDFIESVFVSFGLEFNYIGGGAGSLSLKQKPCIITNEGVLQNVALLVGLELESSVGVKHGWHSIAGPFRITNAVGNELRELDFKPAFEVYKEVVDSHSKKSIQADSFFDIAKAYPFGISMVGSEEVVRDPLLINDEGNIICVGELAKGSFVNILHGNQETLITAATEAAHLATDNITNQQFSSAFFVDCISRVLFLEDNFSKELSAVYNECNVNTFWGLLTIGEIANSRDDFLEFYNKTSVVACF